MTEAQNIRMNMADPIAAAIAAAAELAKNGGAFLYAGDMLKAASVTAGAVFSPPAVASATATATADSSCSMKLPMMIPTSPQVTSRGEPVPLTTSHESDEDADHDSSGNHEDEEEEDAERRMARSRERNREHARKTRLRKKAQLEALQSKVKGLQAESKVLKQSLEECSIASILVGLSSGDHDDTAQSLLSNVTEIEDNKILKLVGSKRKRFVSVESAAAAGAAGERVSQPLKIKIDGKVTVIGGGRTHINWKTGVYSDENGRQRQLTQEQLESLRRERNRMHAKMTRDRKKSFIATIEKTIEELESNNERMKKALADVIQTHFKSSTRLPGVSAAAPVSTTMAPIAPAPTTVPVSPPTVPVISVVTAVPSLQDSFRPIKKVCHGFTLASA